METQGEIKEETRARILNVSHDLFMHYGFNKTTMSDIAKGCDMSPANIYRFYKGKDEIIAEIADSLMRQLESSLREVLRRPGLSASERLVVFVVDKIKHLDHICGCNSKMDEAVEHIKAKKPEVINRHLDAMRSMLAEILAEGNSTGEFEVPNVVLAADSVFKATFLCRCQWVDKCPPIEEVEADARQILGLIINGLRKK